MCEDDNGISTYSMFCRGGTGPYDPPLLLRYGPQCHLYLQGVLGLPFQTFKMSFYTC